MHQIQQESKSTTRKLQILKEESHANDNMALQLELVIEQLNANIKKAGKER